MGVCSCFFSLGEIHAESLKRGLVQSTGTSLMRYLQKSSLAMAVLVIVAFHMNAQAQRGGRSGGGGGMGRGGSSGGLRASGGFGQQPAGGVGQSGGIGPSGVGNSAGRGNSGDGFQNSLDQIRAKGPKNDGNRPAEPRPNSNRNDLNRGDVNNRVNPGRVDGNRGLDNSNLDRYGDHAFSNGWYNGHPNAWRYNNGNTNIYAMAGPGRMNSWWGVPGYGGIGGVGGVGGGIPTGTGGAGGSPATSGNNQAGANKAEADTGEWMPIGVFALLPKGQTEVTRAVQLATDHNGAVKGNHIDLLSDTSTEIHGRYDDKAKTIEWTIGQSNSVVFKASVGDFNDQGKPVPLVANYKDGSTANWTMTPVQDPSEAPSDKKPVAGE